MSYQTSNLNLAAFIMTDGHELEEAFHDNGKVVFKFDIETDESARLKGAFFNGGYIEALGFSENIKNLKRIVYEVMKKCGKRRW